jgi:hypothetical protein
LKSEAWLIFLAPEEIYNPENQRQRDAEHDTSDDRKIETAALALIRDISRQTSQAKWQPPAENKKAANNDKSDSEDEQEFAEFARWFHRNRPRLILLDFEIFTEKASRQSQCERVRTGKSL